MNEPVRCGSCGASNAPDAAWCGQCLTKFGASVEQVAAPAPRHLRPVTPAASAQGIQRRGEELIWACPACESENTIDKSVCTVCATPLARLFGAAPKPEMKRVGRAAVGLSALFPGAGHLWAGKVADGAGRLVMFVWTAGIGALLLTRTNARNADVFRTIGAVHAIAALAVWGVALLEGQRLARGDAAPLLQGRVLLWSSVALTLVLFAGLTLGAQSG